jgi:hypothetical protein
MDITIANAAKIIILIFVIVIKKINNWIAKDKNKNDWKKIFFDGKCGTYRQKKRLPKKLDWSAGILACKAGLEARTPHHLFRQPLTGI